MPEIPSLQKLAAEALSKSKNPNHFFRLYNTPMPDEIIKTYVLPLVNKQIEKQTAAYFDKVENRQKKIEDRSITLSQNTCFVKTAGCTGSMLMSGLHVGIYFILQAAGVDASTQIIWLTTIPVSFIVGTCGGMFLSPYLAKALARCVTPSISGKITINLEELESGTRPPAPPPVPAINP